MSKLVRGHRDKVQQFMTITGSSEKLALQALKSCDWHLEGAFDVFYSQPQVKSYADTRLVEELYKRYKDPYVDMILADGITLLCNDLQVDPQDVVMLVLSWHMKAATMCEFSKQEFIGGLQALGIDSLEKFRDRMQFMRSELKDDQKFREIYIFAFGWAKEKGEQHVSQEEMREEEVFQNQGSWSLSLPFHSEGEKEKSGVEPVSVDSAKQDIGGRVDGNRRRPSEWPATLATYQKKGKGKSSCVLPPSQSPSPASVPDSSADLSGSEVFGIGYCNRDVAVAFCRKAVAIGGSLVSVLAGPA